MGDSLIIRKLERASAKLTDVYSLLQEKLSEELFSEVESLIYDVGETIEEVMNDIK